MISDFGQPTSRSDPSAFHFRSSWASFKSVSHHAHLTVQNQINELFSVGSYQVQPGQANSHKIQIQNSQGFGS